MNQSKFCKTAMFVHESDCIFAIKLTGEKCAYCDVFLYSALTRGVGEVKDLTNHV